MRTAGWRRALARLSFVGICGGLVMAGSVGNAGAVGLGFTVSRVSAYGGEPSIISDHSSNLLYEASLLAPTAYRSGSGGTAWTAGNPAAGGTGDDCLATDQSGALYMCNLTILTGQTQVVQGDVYKSVNQGNTWTHGQGFTEAKAGNKCGTSCSPFGVDRNWIDAYIKPADNLDTSKATVAMMYHDFYGPSHIFVNISTDGGLTFGPPIDILANVDPSAPAQSAIAVSDSGCSTVPAGFYITKSGPHPGRMIAAWIAADPSSVPSGCNLTQAQAFHNLIVAWSDNGGATWIPQVAFDAGPTHDASSPFAAFAIDNQGNPYFGFVNNLNWGADCSLATMPQSSKCEYDMYVVWSKDGGSNWLGGPPGLVPGSAGTPYQVNLATDTGTHWFPAITAGDPGKVTVAYLKTSMVIATDPSGKQHPGGCYPSGNPQCSNTGKFTGNWYLHAAQTLDLLKADGTPNPSPAWDRTQITASPMHNTDICNLGLACPPTANRHLSDFIMATSDIDGCAHIAYADDVTTNEVDSANQTSGPCLVSALGASTPEVRWAALLPVLALAPVGLVAVLRRRRRSGVTELN